MKNQYLLPSLILALGLCVLGCCIKSGVQNF